jgi:hypothetical protein
MDVLWARLRLVYKMPDKSMDKLFLPFNVQP